MSRSVSFTRTLQQRLTNSSVPLGAARTLVGTVVLARPTLLAKGLGLDASSAERTAWLARFFASRDLALGVGALAGSRGCQIAGVASDFSDFLAILVALKARQVKPLPGLLTAATAVSAAVAGGATLLVQRG